MKTGKFLINIFIIFLISIVYHLSSSGVYAADFSTDYQVEYNLSESANILNSKVSFKIRITNLRSDIYVNKFSIAFPKSFSVSALKARDDQGGIIPKISSDEEKTKVDLEFSSPSTGKNSVNTFYLDFNQTNLFKVNGKIWEVVLPVIENRSGETYKVTVNLPKSSNKKISIAKPKPDSISGNQIIWDNPQVKTIYAVFGQSQLYRADLVYHLKNEEIFPIITEISFPPDTLYQKIFVSSVIPKPSEAYHDDDGNFLGKYRLNPLEEKVIVFKGLIEVYMQPRDEVLPVVRSDFSSQKNYLLAEQKYWQIKQNLSKIKPLTTPEDIYGYIVTNLDYDYDKVASKNTRLGADAVLSSPNRAVCLEFTDLFVAATREKGIYSREIEGYGFSFDPKLQPLSLSSDVLHSWPEYYDLKRETWIPVDPTWENTSGIDYFSSLDFNHIVFAIHGKKSDYPLPAGMYKTENSRDIRIEPSTENPSERIELAIEEDDIKSTVSDNKSYQGKVILKNNSNVFLWQTPVLISGVGLKISNPKIEIGRLTPFEKKEIVFTYSSLDKNKKINGSINMEIRNQRLLSRPVKVIPYIYEVAIKVGLGLLVALGTGLVIWIVKNKKEQEIPPT